LAAARGADQHPATGTVFDHESLAELFGKLIADEAGDGIGPAAGGGRDDESHRARRIVLRAQRIRRGEADSGSNDNGRYGQSHDHHVLPSFMSLASC
jgi:hypothetical protein